MTGGMTTTLYFLTDFPCIQLQTGESGIDKAAFAYAGRTCEYRNFVFQGFPQFLNANPLFRTGTNDRIACRSVKSSSILIFVLFISVNLIDDNDNIQFLFLCQQQKSVQQIQIHIGAFCRKDNDRLINIGNSGTDQLISSGEDHIQTSFFVGFIQHRNLHGIPNRRTNAFLTENPSGTAFIYALHRINIIESADSFQNHSIQHMLLLILRRLRFRTMLSVHPLYR